MIITVFKQSSAISQISFSTFTSSELTFTGSIKYDISSELTSKAQERVKENVTKTIKKKTARQKDRNDNDVISEAGGSKYTGVRTR